MGFFGLFSKKEVAEKEEKAKEAVLSSQQSSLQNLAKGSQVKFAVPYFDVFDPRFVNFAVPISVHGMVVYAVDDIDRFNSINKTQNLNDGVFQQKLRGQITKYIKGVVTNAPSDNNIQVLQMERKILEISELVQRLVSPKIEQLFGINIRSLDITEIMVDKSSRGYRELKAVTADIERESITSMHSVRMRQQEMQISGQEELQRMQLDNQRETMRIQREEMQRAARLQTETNFMTAHQANLNAEVGKANAAFGAVPPMPNSAPDVQYMIALNGQQIGPCDWNSLQRLVREGKLTHQTYVWKQGMANWELAGNVQELQPLFGSVPPPAPCM
ncbi:MAG: DUF4339 domain-containing protein [Bacteroidaceae bacterium]|nr:DUF4339 domain-containing protein [Bacteroidaceae bacterium]